MKIAVFPYEHELVFVRILIPFSIGIVTFYGCSATWILASLVLINIFFLAYLAIINFSCKSANIYNYNGLNGLIFHCFIFFIGSLSCILYNQRIQSDYYSFKKSKYLKIRIISEPEKRQNIILFNALVTKSAAVNHSLSAQKINSYIFSPASGKIRVNILTNETGNLTLKYGEELLILAGYTETEPPHNPSEFNYKDWLATQNVYHKILLGQSEFVRLNTNTGNKLIRFALGLREQQVAFYRKIIKNNDAFAVAATLILGYKMNLNAETLDIYSKTGTIHVLSVSGMHVGLIYVVLNPLFFFLNGKQIFRTLKTIIILSMIWFYALLTGFSPSVLRAALMISVFIAAKLFCKHTNSYNIIAFAAFSLLLFNPFLLWDVGFQLSFLAVFGLIYLQPKIKGLVPLKSLWLTKGWDAIAMSLAAQLATYPFSAYYFHQFPVYFLLSNLFIMLPAALIMYLGIIILVFKLGCLGEPFEWLIVFMNSGLTRISMLPFSGISAIWLTKTELVLLCLALTLFIISVNELKKRLLITSVVIFLCLQGLIAYDKLQAFHQKKTIRFTLRKNYAVALLNAPHAILFTDVKPGSKEFSYFIKPALDQHRITHILFKTLP